MRRFFFFIRHLRTATNNNNNNATSSAHKCAEEAEETSREGNKSWNRVSEETSREVAKNVTSSAHLCAEVSRLRDLFPSRRVSSASQVCWGSHVIPRLPQHTIAKTPSHSRSLLQNIGSFIGLFCKRDLWFSMNSSSSWYGVATISRLLTIIGLFCRM